MGNRRLSLPSISSPLTNISVLAGLLAGCFIVFVHRPEDSLAIAALEMILCLALPCALIEVLVNRSPQRAGINFSRRDFSLSRLVRKVIALWAILAVLGFFYHAFAIYRSPFYAPFDWLWGVSIVPMLMLSLVYLAAVDMMQDEPNDALWQLGNRFFSRPQHLSAAEGNYLLGWLVKGFFFPLMFCYLCGQIADLRQFDFSGFHSSSLRQFAGVSYDLLYIAFFFVDLMVSATGYIMTFRLLGTHIRSVEPTVGGWLVAVACYQPFYATLYTSYLGYEHGRPWGVLLSDQPILYTVWGLMIVLCLSIYVWAAICFGIRFSNLTHRGIITTGPYRWTKHPAYISKNISWWLVSIPFLPPDASPWTAIRLCTGLLLINGLYFLRAKTEERHLLRDPVYREYAQQVRDDGVFRRFRFGS
jgi:protein-S-isoprenylcysteine O-methyltransferase Ste14